MEVYFLLLGGYISYDDGYMGFLFIGFGISIIVNFFEYKSHYSKAKQRYFTFIKEQILGFEASPQNPIWEFNEEYVGYTDHKYEAKVKWSTFLSYRIIENNLFLDFDTQNGLSFILGQTEVSKDNWEEILELVGKKIE